MSCFHWLTELVTPPTLDALVSRVVDFHQIIDYLLLMTTDFDREISNPMG